MMNTEIT